MFSMLIDCGFVKMHKKQLLSIPMTISTRRSIRNQSVHVLYEWLNLEECILFSTVK